jgi:hypothetical protein
MHGKRLVVDIVRAVSFGPDVAVGGNILVWQIGVAVFSLKAWLP